MAERFSKARALAVLDKRAAEIAAAHRFDRSNGYAQLSPNKDAHIQSLILRAVEYGRMRAYEDFACAIEENFQFEA